MHGRMAIYEKSIAAGVGLADRGEQVLDVGVPDEVRRGVRDRDHQDVPRFVQTAQGPKPKAKRHRSLAEAVSLRGLEWNQIEETIMPRLELRTIQPAKKIPRQDLSELIAALEALSAPPSEETTVRGYKVKVSRKTVTAAEADDRRKTIARVLSGSMQSLSSDR